MKLQKHYWLFMLLLCLFIDTACKQDRKMTSEEKAQTIDTLMAKIDGIDADTSNQTAQLISKDVLKARDSILRKQIEASKLVSMSCDQILEKYREAMKAAKAGDNTKLLAIDANDPVFNGCRSSEPYKSKFEAIDLEYQD